MGNGDRDGAIEIDLVNGVNGVKETTFFLLQLNPVYMKRILHFKNITFKSSYNWFRIDIHQQLRPLTTNYLAMFIVTSTTTGCLRKNFFLSKLAVLLLTVRNPYETFANIYSRVVKCIAAVRGHCESRRRLDSDCRREDITLPMSDICYPTR